MADLDPAKVEIAVIEEQPPTPVHVITDRPRKVYAGMWGPAEIGVLAVAAMAFLSALIVFFFFVVPSNRELAYNKGKADMLEAEVTSARSKYGEITSTQDQVGKLVSSVDDFETRFLPAVANGQSSLYQRINTLIIGHGLINTTGPDYQPLETVDQNSQGKDDDKGRERFRSLYPGVYVTMTVEGSYQNLRRFVRDIETGNEFIVISSIELAPSDSQPTKPTVAAVPGQPQLNDRQVGKMHGEIIALHIELAAYFRRLNYAPAAQQ